MSNIERNLFVPRSELIETPVKTPFTPAVRSSPVARINARSDGNGTEMYEGWLVLRIERTIQEFGDGNVADP